MENKNSKTIKVISLLFVIAVLVLALSSCTKKQEHTETSSAHKALYFCPMHPQVTSEKQGVCPICHMDLVLQTADNLIHDGNVKLSEGSVVLAGVKTFMVRSGKIEKEITTLSILDIPEQNRRIISAKFSGRIEKLFAAQTGTAIKKGDLLFTVYSPEVFRTAAEYLLAKANYESGKNTDAQKLMNSARKRLDLYGVPQQYISAIEKQSEAEYTFQYYAPYSGIIVKKNIIEGAYISEGNELYEVADIETLWNVADVYEHDASLLRLDMPVHVRFSALPGESFAGKISFISPIVESSSRTVKVRVVLQNTKNHLRARMFGETVFVISFGEGVLIPADAVIFTGKRSVVWVKHADGQFAVRDIQTGVKIGERYQVLSGLSQGDEIVTQGNYLIDSESRLKSGVQAEKDMASTVGTGAENGAVSYIDKNNAVYKKQGVFNKHCPVLGDEVADDGPLLLYKGKVIGFCCKGCDKKFVKDPALYFSYISPDGKRYTGPKQ